LTRNGLIEVVRTEERPPAIESLYGLTALGRITALWLTAAQPARRHARWRDV
jgi:hypothetical protein